MIRAQGWVTLAVVAGFSAVVPGAYAQVPADLRQLILQRDNAVTRGDGATWDRLTTEDFTVVGPAGARLTKAERLAQLKAQGPRERAPSEREEIRSYGNVVIRRSVTNGDWVLETWVKGSKGWQVSSVQVTTSSETEAANAARARAAIEKSNQEYAAASMRGDARVMAEQMSSDVMVLSTDGRADLKGRAAYEAELQKRVAARPFDILERRLVTDSLSVHGNWAYEVGHNYTVRRPKTNPSAKPDTVGGRYITFWARGNDGAWRSTLDFTPPAAGPAATSAARLQLTSTSDAAKGEFRTALWHAQNAFGGKALIHLDKALALDPQFGLAQVFHGILKPGLTEAQRQDEYSRGLAALTKASPAEQLLGLVWRERVSGRQPMARTTVELLLPMVPADGDIALEYYNLRNFGRSRSEVLANWREATTKYPDVPILWRGLGYALFASGDHAGGITAMREHVRLEPRHPNARESLAEVLGNDGQYQEAMLEDQRALALDSSFTGPYAHLADIKLVQGNITEARALWQNAANHGLTLGDTLGFAYSTALSFVLEGNGATAMTRLSDVARRADPVRPLVAGGALAPLSHQTMAVLSALQGNGAAASAHLGRAVQVGDSNSASYQGYAAFTFAASRDLDRARRAAERFSSVGNNGNAFSNNVLFRHTLDGFIAMQADDAATAVREFGQSAANDPLAKALLAELHAKGGRQADAQALREEVRQAPALMYAGAIENFWAILAKQRAKGTKVS